MEIGMAGTWPSASMSGGMLMLYGAALRLRDRRARCERAQQEVVFEEEGGHRDGSRRAADLGRDRAFLPSSLRAPVETTAKRRRGVVGGCCVIDGLIGSKYHDI